MKKLKFSTQMVIFTFVLVTSLLITLSACSSATTTPTPTATTPEITATTTPTETLPSTPEISPSPSLTTLPSPSPSSSPVGTPSGSPSPPISTSPSSPSPSASAAGYTINVSSKTGMGNYLVDANGMTLYYFANDVNGKSNAAGAILQTWPIFNAATISVPASLNASDFATITRPDGQMQTTYKGWPLYSFANDKAPGDTLGDGVGGVWFLIDLPFYTVMLQSRTDFGTYLVDPKGMTLYYNNKDSAGTSNVTGNTLTVWPIFNAGTFVVPSSLNATDFGTITRSDGQMQTTYKGSPLYYYANDKASGDALGNGLGGEWFAISIANFPPTPTTTATSGGY